MNKITEIIRKYSEGGISLEDANKQLEKAKSPVTIDPNKNVITQYEKDTTTVGYYPWQANGTGMLDTGTGTMDKVQVHMGHVKGFNSGNMLAYVYICGKVYKVQGDTLVIENG